MRIDKEVVVQQLAVRRILRCDICQKEQQSGPEPEWLSIRGEYHPQKDEYKHDYDVCSGVCAQKALERIAVESLVA